MRSGCGRWSRLRGLGDGLGYIEQGEQNAAQRGLAAGGVSQYVDDDYSGVTDTISDTRFGWVAGVGAEAMLADNMSVKGEVLFHDLGAEDVTFENGTTYYDNDVSFTTFKVGLNFHF